MPIETSARNAIFSLLSEQGTGGLTQNLLFVHSLAAWRLCSGLGCLGKYLGQVKFMIEEREVRDAAHFDVSGGWLIIVTKVVSPKTAGN